eukprot:TRINITY_DN33564_c0_g1_i1.p2 TRINITY_DN33564_c0_g1~~TRINITY_DN33564_c0_g1_i1.p2  ORF type:complete len:157 (-),score=60.57 TRINITY_DN33564_c0_g1_i1:152-622(-)
MGVVGELSTSGKHGQFIDALQSLTNLLGWVSLDKLPVAYLKENKEIMDFPLTKLMQQSADNRAWAQGLMKTAAALITYVDANHKCGLTFGAAGAAAPAAESPASQPASASSVAVIEVLESAVAASESMDASVSSATKLALEAFKEHEALILSLIHI